MLLRFQVLYLFDFIPYPYTAGFCPSANKQTKLGRGEWAVSNNYKNKNDFYEGVARFFFRNAGLYVTHILITL